MSKISGDLLTFQSGLILTIPPVLAILILRDQTPLRSSRIH